MATGSAAVATVRAGLRADYAAVLTDADLAVMVGLASKYSPAPATAATPCDLPVLSLRIFEHNPQNGPERLMFKHLGTVRLRGRGGPRRRQHRGRRGWRRRLGSGRR